jgi:hypothetical protein
MMLKHSSPTPILKLSRLELEIWKKDILFVNENDSN